MTREDGRQAEQEPLSEEQLEELTELLKARRAKILRGEEIQMEAVKSESALRMSDEVDLATAEYDQAFEFRIRDRERMLLRKVEKALNRIDEGEYDECEECNAYIGYKRLAARPEATLCIECKEEQERVERNYSKRRDRDAPFSFK